MRYGLLCAFLCAATPVAFAGTWSGALVDAGCYRNELDNVSPDQSLTYSGRDMEYSVRYCAPNAKTRKFAVVEDDWNVLRLDAAGNAKAADLVRQAGRRRPIEVRLIGQIDRNRVKVESISRIAPL